MWMTCTEEASSVDALAMAYRCEAVRSYVPVALGLVAGMAPGGSSGTSVYWPLASRCCRLCTATWPSTLADIPRSWCGSWSISGCELGSDALRVLVLARRCRRKGLAVRSTGRPQVCPSGLGRSTLCPDSVTRASYDGVRLTDIRRRGRRVVSPSRGDTGVPWLSTEPSTQLVRLLVGDPTSLARSLPLRGVCGVRLGNAEKSGWSRGGEEGMEMGPGCGRWGGDGRGRDRDDDAMLVGDGCHAGPRLPPAELMSRPSWMSPAWLPIGGGCSGST